MNIQEKIKIIKRNLFLRAGVFILGFLLVGYYFFNYLQNKPTFLAGNLIFVVDLTNSMNVNDVFYNSHQVSRLTLAKKIIENTAKKLNKPIGVVVFADRFNYYIPPTLDDESLITYVKVLNTNFLDGGKLNLEALSSGLNNYVSKNDTLVFLSDFDFPPNLKLNNFTYFVGIGKTTKGIVKNADDKTLFLNGQPLYSSLNLNTIKKLAKKYGKYYIVSNYKKDELLPFLRNLGEDNYIANKSKISWELIVGLALILLAL